MGLNVTGKTVLFVKAKETKEGVSFNEYTLSVSKKTKDGYDNSSIKAEFDMKEYPDIDKKLKAEHYYQIEILEGWLTNSIFTNKEGKKIARDVIHIKDANVTDEKPIVRTVKTEEKKDSLI